MDGKQVWVKMGFVERLQNWEMISSGTLIRVWRSHYATAGGGTGVCGDRCQTKRRVMWLLFVNRSGLTRRYRNETTYLIMFLTASWLSFKIAVLPVPVSSRFVSCPCPPPLPAPAPLWSCRDMFLYALLQAPRRACSAYGEYVRCFFPMCALCGAHFEAAQDVHEVHVCVLVFCLSFVMNLNGYGALLQPPFFSFFLSFSWNILQDMVMSFCVLQPY